MNLSSRRPRQPVRDAWTYDRLVRERAIALGHAIDSSTHLSYTSHVHSYLAFCKLHNFSIEPTPDTLSFFVVYMCHYIKPSSVDSYLSGICNQLEHLYPDIRRVRKGYLVSRTLAGCKRMLNSPTTRKAPLQVEDIELLFRLFPPISHDNLLFRALLLAGVLALHRLGELTWSDDPQLRSWRKVIKRSSARLTPTSFSYTLPSSKADHIFEGNLILITAQPGLINAVPTFTVYLRSRDALHPFQPALWLTSAGAVPTRSWFMNRLRTANLPNVGGHSMRAGGATFFAAAGWPDDRIQALGRWSSQAFKIYIRKNPVVLQALLHSRTSPGAPSRV